MKKTLFTSMLALCCVSTAMADTTNITYTSSNYIAQASEGTTADGNFNQVIFSLDSDSYDATLAVDTTSTTSDAVDALINEAKDYFTDGGGLTLESISLIGNASKNDVSNYYAYITVDGITYTSDYCVATADYPAIATDNTSDYWTRQLLTFDFSESGLVITADTSYTLSFGYTTTDEETGYTSETTYVDFNLLNQEAANDWYMGSKTNYGPAGMTVTTSAYIIPEPATASLSFLALCGLMIRRRRQA